MDYAGQRWVWRMNEDEGQSGNEDIVYRQTGGFTFSLVIFSLLVKSIIISFVSFPFFVLLLGGLLINPINDIKRET